MFTAGSTLGDTTTKLAFEHGLFPDTLWNHPDNEDLRSKRDDPNVLYPGDKIFIPDIELRDEACRDRGTPPLPEEGHPDDPQRPLPGL